MHAACMLAMMAIAATMGKCEAGEAETSGARALESRWQISAFYHNTTQKDTFMACLY